MKFIDKISIYYLIIGFLLFVHFLGVLNFGPQVLWQILPPVMAALVVGGLVDYLRFRSLKPPITSLITGLIIALVGQFGETALKLALVAAAAMLVKFFARVGGRHIFNPAGGGLFLGAIFLSSYPSWWVGGVQPWVFAVWLLLLMYKFKRWAPVVGFLGPSLILSGPNILISSSMWFFLTVMLIEPKTSPFQLKSGLIYGVVVAVSFWWYGLGLTLTDPLIAALLTGNFMARLLERFPLIS